MLSYVRFRYRRWIRRFRRDTRILRKWAHNYIDRHIWGKWHQVRVVWRFLLGWWFILGVACIGLVQTAAGLNGIGRIAVPEPGGIYNEAAIGSVQLLNPVLPESATASDINRLLFSGLTRYNSRRQLIPDLATSWDISADGKTYTFHLRQGVKWHDNVPFTSADVAFTLTAIQNPDSRSPLASSWQGVTVTPKDNYTVSFVLPQPLSSFMDSTTVGIVPRHLLESVEPSQLREAAFNQNPVGTGPFKLKTFAPSAHIVELSANPSYYFGRPQLDEFNFKFYDTPQKALLAYAGHQVTSPGQITPGITEQAARMGGLTEYDFTLPEEQTLFFATGDPALSDKSLRSILSQSLDRGLIIDKAAAGQGVAMTQPLLPGQAGYTTKYVAPNLSTSAANAALDAVGWKLGTGDKVRKKDGKALRFKLVTLKGTEQQRAAEEIKRQWAPLGVNIEVLGVANEDLQQTYMRPRNFQMLLYGVNLGSDPDVYSFWHSSQAKDPGINLSGYNSVDADRALEAGRIKSDALIRQGKYDAFLKAWDADAPSAVLYQTGYVYAVSKDVAGVMARRLVTPADRYYGIERWTVRQHYVPAR